MEKQENIYEKRLKLIEFIRSVPSNFVYDLAPPKYIKRGYDYYRRGRLERFEWIDDVLIAFVRGGEIYNVHISFRNGYLQTSCNCLAYHPSTNCKHIICALFSLKNLISPGKFLPSPFHQNMRVRLLKSLEWGVIEDTEEGFYSQKTVLIFSIDENSIFFEKGGWRATYFGLPQELSDLLYQITSGNIAKKDIEDRSVKIVCRMKEKDIPLKLKENITLKPRIVFESLKKKPYATLTVEEGNESKQKFVLAGKNVLINLDEQWLSILENEQYNRLKFLYNRFLKKDEGGFFLAKFKILPYRMSLNLDSPLKLSEKELCILRESSFVIDGNPRDLEEVVPEYHIDIVPLNEKYAEIFVNREIDGETFPLPRFPFYVISDIWKGAYRPIRNAKRKKIFFDTLINLVEEHNNLTSKDIEKALIKVFFEEARPVSRLSLESYLSFIVNVSKGIKKREEYSFFFHKNKWILFGSHIKQCFRLLAELYNVFEPSDIVDVYSYDSLIIVRNKALIRNLDELVKNLTEKGVRVTYRGKKIKHSTWDVTINFQSNIDWFELRPEIKVDNRVISQDELQRLLEKLSGNMVETEDSIEVVPENVKEVLRRLGIREGKKTDRDNREVVQIPRLQILNWLSLRKKGVKLRLPPKEEQVIESLLSFKGIEPVKVPEGFKGKLRRYQKEGYDWLCFLYEHRFGACLADDMGLGKTIQSIAFLGARKEGIIGKGNPSLPHLIVVPPSLVFNWELELKRFYPSFRVLTYTGVDRKLSIENTDIVLTTYAIMRLDIDKLIKHRFDIVIFDEAQAVKNIYAATTSSARKLNAGFKLALTGTPVENHLGEYFSIIDLCLPGLMGDYKEFKGALKQNREELLDEIIKRTAPFVLRRTKEEILKELPPKTEADIYLELTERQKALYTRIVKEIKKDIDEAFETKTEQQAKIIVLSALMRLRRLCLSPALLDRELSAESPKVDFLLERLFLLREQKHSALVFSQFTSFLDIVEKKLKASGLRVLRLDGSTPQKKRKELVRRFQNDGEADVFLLSLKAGGQGLNLTRATYVFHLDPWWNPAVEQQATDRTHRIGQKRKVNVIKILMRHTIEEKMQDLKKQKRALYDALLGKRKSSRGVKLTRKDIEFLLKIS